MQADFDDLRFTNASDTPLDYWLEAKTDGVSAIIWVEVDSIAASDDTIIYMYYGNPDVGSESNGVDTFDWFDDFEDGSISGSYTKIGYDGWSEADGILTYTTGGTTFSDPNILKIDNNTYGWGYEIRGKIRVRQWQNHDYSRMGLGLRTEGGDGYGYKGLFHWRSGNKNRAILHNWRAWLTESTFNWSLDTWYWIAFYAELGGSTRYLYEKDWLVGDAEPSWLLTTSSTVTDHQDGQPCIAGCSIPNGGLSTQFIGDWDDVFVRKCVYPDEPTYSVGPEESLPTVDIDVSDTLINEADDGGIFDVVLTFSKAMNTGVTPTISFDPDVVTSGTLTFASDAWSGGDTMYTATYDTADVDEEVVDIDVSVGGAEDLAGNPQNPDPTTEVNLFDVDTVAPTVDITSTATDPTATSPIPMTATFSENVTGFVLGDIVVGNGTAGNFAGGPAVFIFDVTPVTDGLVTVDIDANVAQDAAGNNNTAASQFTIAYDSTGQTGGSTKDIYRPGEDVRVSARGFLPGSDVDVYVVADYAWNDGDNIPPDAGTVFAQNTFTADIDGEIVDEVIWYAPLEVGEYDIAFDTYQDGFYDELWDMVDDPNHPGFTVLGATVGGEVYPIDKTALLLPWLGLGAVLILAAGGLILARRVSRLIES